MKTVRIFWFAVFAGLVCLGGVTLMIAYDEGTYPTTVAITTSSSLLPPSSGPDFPRRAFPHQEPYGQNRVVEFDTDTPYRVLKVDTVCGIADVEEADGNTFFSRNADVMKLGPGTYFKVIKVRGNTNAEDRDTIVKLSPFDIDFNKTNYYNVGP